jgi:hypothetical protein
MNGATEQTLAELLATARAMNGNIIALQRLIGQMNSSGGGGGGAASSASSGIAGMARAIPGVSLAMGALSGAANLVSGLFSTLGSILGKVVSGITDTAANFFEFSIAAAKGTASLSQFYAVFKDLPFFIGSLFSAFSKLMAYTEDLLKSYQDITRSGASFSGDLYKMASMAQRSYMTLEQFGRVVSENSKYFAIYGDSVEGGLKRFVDVQNRFLGPSSPYAKGIFGLGVTAEEASGYLAGMMASQGNMAQSQRTTNKSLMENTSNYIYLLDSLSKLTGKRRDQIDAEVRKAEDDQSWMLFVDGLNDGQKEFVKVLTATAKTVGGQGYEDLVRSQLRGLDAPLTDAARKFTVFTNGVAMDGNNVRQALSMAADPKRFKEAQALFFKDVERLSREGGKFIDQVGRNNLAIPGISDFVVPEITNLYRILQKHNGNIGKAMEEIRKQQDKQAGGNAAATATAQQNIKIFGAGIMELVYKIIGPISNKLAEWGLWLTNHLPDITKKFEEPIKNFVKFMGDVIWPKLVEIGNWFGTQFNKLLGSKSPKEFFENLVGSLKEGFTNIWREVKPVWDTEIKPVIISMWEGLIKVIEPLFLKMFHHVQDAMNAWIYEKIGTKFGLAEDPIERKKYREKQYKEWDTKSAFEDLRDQFKEEKKLGKLSKDRLDELYEKTRQAALAYYRAMNPTANPTSESLGLIDMLPQRSMTSFGATGKFIENWGKGTPVMLHGEEGVVNQEQLNSIAQSSLNNNLADGIERLNSLTGMLIAEMRQNNDYTRKNLDATKALNNNLFTT